MKNKSLNIQGKKISEILKYIRKKEQLSQRELAKKLDVSNALISRIEDESVKTPSLDFLIKLSELYHISFVNLAKNVGYRFPNNDIVEKIRFLTDLPEERILSFVSFNDTEFDEKIEYLDLEKLLKGYKENLISLNDTKAMITAMSTIDIHLNSIDN